ncbi:MAG TPA: Crp/Fnr family transcriptional regulator [Gallionellaceae bacterium]|nr:Crp/Fnr family transcriptional regulator [Gallionellaceae bacterium]
MHKLPVALKELLPEKLGQECVFVPCVKGEWLIQQGKKPQQMFYVASGEVVLQRLGTQGENRVLQRARQCFVAEASIQSPSYHCDAMVTVSGELVAIPIELVRQALLADPAFAMRWVGMLNRELKRLRAQCERLSLKGVRDRLLHLIESEGQCGRLALGAGLKSIALELGVTHEALYRTVAEMEKQGVLRREAGQLLVI